VDKTADKHVDGFWLVRKNIFDWLLTFMPVAVIIHRNQSDRNHFIAQTAGAAVRRARSGGSP